MLHTACCACEVEDARKQLMKRGSSMPWNLFLRFARRWHYHSTPTHKITWLCCVARHVLHQIFAFRAGTNYGHATSGGLTPLRGTAVTGAFPHDTQSGINAHVVSSLIAPRITPNGTRRRARQSVDPRGRDYAREAWSGSSSTCGPARRRHRPATCSGDRRCSWGCSTASACV